MEIKEAQEISRKHGISSCSDARKSDVMLYLSTEQYNVICTIEAALDNGYQLCKVDEVIEKIQQRAWKEDSIEVEDCIDILKEACL